MGFFRSSVEIAVRVEGEQARAEGDYVLRVENESRWRVKNPFSDWADAFLFYFEFSIFSKFILDLF